MTYPLASAFQPQSITHETIAINTALALKMAHAGTPADLADAREQFASGKRTTPITPRSPDAREVSITSGNAQIMLRIIAHPDPAGVYLHIHGGGWMVGRADMRDGQLQKMADDTGMACVSVEYRLAPEHPYPAPVEDCEAAANWLIDHAMAQFGSQKLCIGGESAGAHLAVLTLLRLRKAGRQHHFLGANLAYGVYDLSLTPSAASAEQDLVCNRHEMLEAGAAFRAGMDARSAEVSPLYADLSRLPPALFSVGTLDPLLDDSLLMHARWLMAGNDGLLAVYPGGLHGFNTYGGALANEANARMHNFLKSKLEGTRRALA
ncbi:MAG: alpha/beta hydrolase, partial [Janthinobacterium lividum]